MSNRSIKKKKTKKWKKYLIMKMARGRLFILTKQTSLFLYGKFFIMCFNFMVEQTIKLVWINIILLIIIPSRWLSTKYQRKHSEDLLSILIKHLFEESSLHCMLKTNLKIFGRQQRTDRYTIQIIVHSVMVKIKCYCAK